MDKTLGALLLAALITRGGLDLLWWAAIPGVRSLGAVVSALLIAVFVMVVGVSRSQVSRTLALPMAAFTILVAGAFTRGPGGWVDALRWSLLYLGPLAFGAAVLVARPTPKMWVRGILIAGSIPLGASLFLLASGQPHELVLHGYPRLVGPFKNHHNLAVMASGVGLVSLFGAMEERGPWRWWAVAMGIGWAVCLYFTYVRTCWILVAGSVAVWLLLEKRWTWLAVAALTAAVSLGLSPTLQERFSDIGHVLSGVPPQEGWGAIGSSRVHIWTDSFANFALGGLPSLAFGDGLGGHMGLHKDLDPHSEYLTLLYQFGVAGPVAYLWLFGAAAWGCWQRDTGLGRLVFGVVVMTGLTCIISNDFLGRTTFAWGFWAAIAMTWTNPSREGGDGRCEHQGRPDPEGLRELGGEVG